MKQFYMLALLALLVVGCGYRQSNVYQTPPADRESVRFPVRTVHIATFENDTGMTDLPAQLSDRLRTQVAADTPYRIADASSAESAVRGRITRVKPREGVKSPSSVDEVQSYRIEYEWRDLWHEKSLIKRETIDAPTLADAARQISARMYSGTGGVSTPGSDGYVWHSLYREDVRTVAVPIFTNRSFTRGIELQLTKAITNYMESNTPYRVASRDKADTILEGEITHVTGNMVSADAYSALPQEEMVTITVNFVWKDLRTGKILAQRRGFQQSTMYYPTLGESSYVGKQTGAERLATAIVQELQAEW